MRKSKWLIAVFAAILTVGLAMFALSACSEPNDDDKELVAVEIENVPDEIIIGEFDDANITIKLSYDDESVDRIPFTEEMVPNNQKHYLTEAGEHEISFPTGAFTVAGAIPESITLTPRDAGLDAESLMTLDWLYND